MSIPNNVANLILMSMLLIDHSCLDRDMPMTTLRDHAGWPN